MTQKTSIIFQLTTFTRSDFTALLGGINTWQGRIWIMEIVGGRGAR